ncbi:MAG: ABC transporter substrate-binding protein [Gammaproteobacteria bacterium]|nr:MAG: ABC transporter substrate-binding protein [Gammaproteobacteria bacterium]
MSNCYPYRSTLFLLYLLVVFGCSENNQSSVKDTGLVYCSQGSPETFNPQVGTSGTSFDANARVLFNRLLSIDSATGDILPSLAKQWKKSRDGLIYTLDLRHEVQFHTTQWFKPSRSFNSSDVLFSFERQANKDHFFHQVEGMTYNYFNSTGLADNLLDVSAIDHDTVAFHLKEPDPSFLIYLTMEFSSILSAEYAEHIQKNNIRKEEIDHKPIGTGPFKLKRYQTDAFIRYTAHPDYMDGAEAIENLVFAITPDPSLRYARLISGECDVMAQPLSSHYQLLKNNPELRVQHQAGLNIGYWAFNTLIKPFDNPTVRKALSHAINRETILQTVFNNLGEISNSPLPITMKPYHNDRLAEIKYDPELAKKLLAEAGYGDGFEMDIWAIPIQRPYNPDGHMMAELMQEDLRQIGVKANIVSYNWATFLNKVSQGEHQTALLGWVADTQDAGNFLSNLLSCSAIKSKTNRAFWCNPVFDDLITQAQHTSNMKLKKNLYYSAQEIFREELPWLPIGSGQSIQASHRDVKNLNIRLTGGISFSGVNKEVPSS